MAFFYTEIEGFDDLNYMDYNIIIRDHAYIQPVFKGSDFTYNTGNPSDIIIKLEWNDAKGNLRGIYPMQEGQPEVSADEYTVTDYSIIIKKEFLKKLKSGRNQYSLEFGDVAFSINIIIQD